MADQVVIFTAQGARILTGVDIRDYAGRTDVLINPKSFPRGVPPHCWTLVDGKIVAGDPKAPEAVQTAKDLGSTPPPRLPHPITVFIKKNAAAFVTGASATMFVYEIVKHLFR